MHPNRIAGRRFLVAAEYIEHGGTRTYLQSLLDFYRRHGAYALVVTSFESDDQDMRSLVNDFGFRLVRFSDFAQAQGMGSDRSPTVWSRRAFREERYAFRRLMSEHELTDATVSVGTSGLFLSALAAAHGPLLIAHGYPHGRRQAAFGRHWMGPLVPLDARIITVSDYSGRRFREAWDLDARGIPTRTVRSTCGERSPAAPLEHRTPVVLTAALIEEHKRPLDWLRTADATLLRHRNPELEFRWLGEGPLRSQVEAERAAMGIEQVSFPGWRSDLASDYESARVYLQMSSIESLGLSAVDALRHGLPSVVTDAGGLPEVVIDGVNGFVVPVGDVAAASEAVDELLSDDALWVRQSHAAQEIYDERFSPRQWDREMLEAHVRR